LQANQLSCGRRIKGAGQDKGLTLKEKRYLSSQSTSRRGPTGKEIKKKAESPYFKAKPQGKALRKEGRKPGNGTRKKKGGEREELERPIEKKGGPPVSIVKKNQAKSYPLTERLKIGCREIEKRSKSTV